MAESGGSSIGFGNNRYQYYYGPEGRLVLDETPNKVQLLEMPELLVVKEQNKNEEMND
jgi:hypothetical protein